MLNCDLRIPSFLIREKICVQDGNLGEGEQTVNKSHQDSFTQVITTADRMGSLSCVCTRVRARAGMFTYIYAH